MAVVKQDKSRNKTSEILQGQSRKIMHFTTVAYRLRTLKNIILNSKTFKLMLNMDLQVSP